MVEAQGEEVKKSVELGCDCEPVYPIVTDKFPLFMLIYLTWCVNDISYFWHRTIHLNLIYVCSGRYLTSPTVQFRTRQMIDQPDDVLKVFRRICLKSSVSTSGLSPGTTS